MILFQRKGQCKLQSLMQFLCCKMILGAAKLLETIRHKVNWLLFGREIFIVLRLCNWMTYHLWLNRIKRSTAISNDGKCSPMMGTVSSFLLEARLLMKALWQHHCTSFITICTAHSRHSKRKQNKTSHGFPFPRNHNCRELCLIFH